MMGCGGTRGRLEAMSVNPKKSPCYLRKTEIELADGNSYTFRALPFSRDTIPIIRTLMNDEAGMDEKALALIAAVEVSLSYDYPRERVAEMLGNGLVNPMDERIMGALMAGVPRAGADE